MNGTCSYCAVEQDQVAVKVKSSQKYELNNNYWRHPRSCPYVPPSIILYSSVLKRPSQPSYPNLKERNQLQVIFVRPSIQILSYVNDYQAGKSGPSIL